MTRRKHFSLTAFALVLGLLGAELAIAGNNNTPNAWGVLRQLFLDDLSSAENEVNMDVRRWRRAERDLWRQFENNGFIDFDAYERALRDLERGFDDDERAHRQRCDIKPVECQPGGGGNSTDR